METSSPKGEVSTEPGQLHKTWDPSLVRELGIGFAQVEQKRGMAAAGGAIGAASPTLAGYFSNWIDQSVVQGKASILDLIPVVGSIQAARAALGACFSR
jgi:hypothetical protein